MAKDFAKTKSPTNKPRTRAKSTPAKATKRKNNTRKTNTPNKKAPIWLWLVIGVCLMGFALFLTKLSNQPSQTPPVATAPIETVEKKPESQVRFDFYEILKGKEVNVDAKVIDRTPEKSNIIYWLQVASFKQAAAADHLRVKLLLTNLTASIEKTTNTKGEQWHRVMAGPFDTRSKLAKARGVLASNQINAIVIKRKAK
jgi:cell division protein FtsN